MTARKVSSIVALTIVTVLVLILTISGVAAKQPERSGDLLISNLAPARELQQAWTAERMQNAKPYPLPAFEKGQRPECQGSPAVGASAGLAPSGMPDQEYSVEAVKAGIQYFPAAGADRASPDTYGYPPPYTRYEAIPLYLKLWPQRTVGKLYFTQNGGDYYCTASSIGNYAIWAAGHCVNDGAGNWSTNFYFVAAEMNWAPTHPALTWGDWYNAWTFTDWSVYGDYCRDSGGVTFWPNAYGLKVSVVGWLGFAWGMPEDTHWTEIGYPGSAPFDGSKQIVCSSSRSWYDTCYWEDNPYTMATGCDQTPGCSGGPWIMDYQPLYAGANNYLNGNFSYHYIGYEEEKYSPYFDDSSYGLWDVLINEVPAK